MQIIKSLIERTKKIIGLIKTTIKLVYLSPALFWLTNKNDEKEDK